MACIPLSAAIGAPFSTSLLYLDGVLGYRGWQWMFLLEGIPSIILGVVTYFYLTGAPVEAKWLDASQRAWLTARLKAEGTRKMELLSLGMLETLWNGRVIVLSVVAFFIAAQLLGVGFFLPTIVKGFGLTNMQTGLVSIIPPACGAAAMIWWGQRSDRLMERRYHLAGAMTVGALGIIGAGFIGDPVLKMVAFTISAIGLNASLPVFWTLAPAFLTGPSAAIGIAFINSVAALGAFLAPYMLGLVKDATGSFAGGLYILGGGVIVGAVFVLSFAHDHALEHAPETRAGAV
jgi:MFS family permease